MGKACKIVQHYATTGFSTVMLAWAAHRTSTHYYRNTDLSRLGNLCCPGFPTGNARPGQKGVSFCPGSQRHVPGAPFCLGWCYQPGQKVHFFLFLFSQLFFYFDYTFTFQLNLCIGIQCVRSPLIYTYIYSYLYNICPR